MRGYAAKAIEYALTQFSDFWLLASMTDLSFEEGARGPRFRRALEAFCKAGLPKTVADELREGINGVLQRALEDGFPKRDVRRRKSGTPDLSVRYSDDCEVIIESKHMWSMVFPWQVPKRMRHDQHKLDWHKAHFPNADVLQVVWFIEVPYAYYPAGIWYGTERWGARGIAKNLQITYPSINSQYLAVSESLGRSASWPQCCPSCHQLRPPQTVESSLIKRCFDARFEPDDKTWKFEPETYFKNAAIGVAVWEY